MKISTFALLVEHGDDEDPVDVILQNIHYRVTCGDWKDYITTEKVE